MCTMLIFISVKHALNVVASMLKVLSFLKFIIISSSTLKEIISQTD